MRKSSKVKIISGDRVFDLVVYTLAFFMVLLIAYPLWFVILASFSSASDISRGEVWIWPKEWLLDGYRELINQKDVWTGYRNTIFYTITGTLFSTSVNVSAGFALSRKELLGRKWISIFYLIPMFVSGGLIPTFLVVKQFGFVDSFWVMIIPFAVSCYNIIVSRTFFSNSLPDGLWEAAQIDGCGTLRYFFRIALPLSKAILAVNALWTAVWLWNSWFNALIYLNTESLQPLQLALRRILIINATGAGTVGQEAIEMRNKADMMRYGAIVISTLPIMCLYPFLQNYFNQGVMIGSLKE